MNRHDFAAMIEHDLFMLLDENSLGGGALTEMMAYATLSGGKRLRPSCILLGAEAVGGDANKLLPQLRELGKALEVIHCYSLVHDDLPSMDNDDLRRGKPTVHKQYGVANAILTGDALLNLGYEILLEGIKRFKSDAFNEAAAEIAKVAGVHGMVYGQYLDLKGARDLRGIIALNSMKTGKLFEGACAAGGLLAEASSAQVQALRNYGQNLGAAFQIVDDLRDVKKDSVSVVAVAGEEKAKGYVVYYMQEAKKQANSLPNPAGLNNLADDMSGRNY